MKKTICYFILCICFFSQKVIADNEFDLSTSPRTPQMKELEKKQFLEKENIEFKEFLNKKSFTYWKVGSNALASANFSIGSRVKFGVENHHAFDISFNGRALGYAIPMISLKSSYLYYNNKNYYIGAGAEGGIVFIEFWGRLSKIPIPNVEVILGREFISKYNKNKFIQVGIDLLPVFLSSYESEPWILPLSLSVSYGAKF